MTENQEKPKNTFYADRRPYSRPSRPYYTKQVWCRLCQRILKDGEIWDDMVKHGIVTINTPVIRYDGYLRKDKPQ